MIIDALSATREGIATNKENPKILILDVKGMTPSNLEKSMNQLYERGYKRIFQSDIHWYQGKGDCGIIAFELQEGLGLLHDMHLKHT